MRTFYGGTFMDKEVLREGGIEYPVKLEYYKIKETEEEKYGVEIIRTSYKSDQPEIIKEQIVGVTQEENEMNQILDVMKEGQVGITEANDIIYDFQHADCIWEDDN